MKERRPPVSIRDSTAEFILFALVGVAAVTLFALGEGISFSSGDLIDTDGYMRFLRIQDLMENGGWFRAVSERSNYPYGEVLHWTRPVDALLVAVAAVLRPLAGESALYFAAVAFGPASLLALGAAMRWAFGYLLPAIVRPVLLPGLLALPVVVGYTVPGRVDHHSLLFVLFVFALGATLRLPQDGGGAGSFTLGAVLALGLWVSPEFLVPVGLVALTLGLRVGRAGGSSGVDAVVRVFVAAAVGTLAALFLERGAGWSTVDYARISIVHPFLMAVIGIGFWVYRRLVIRPWGRRRRLAALTGLGAAAAAVSVTVFPELLSGPFVDFHPLVRERWLSVVVELQPITEWGLAGAALLVWPLAALLLGARELRRASGEPPRWLAATLAWLLVYLGLGLYQARWIYFAQILAVPVLISALAPMYRRLGQAPWAAVARPVVVAALVAIGVSLGVASSEATPPEADAARCELGPVLPNLAGFPSTTVLAEQDAGPEILYRTSHNVVATPYGNEEAFLYTFDVMAEADVGAARDRLHRRDIGLILVCPGRLDIMRPEEVSGTFYEALVVGPRPDFVKEVPLPETTDYLLFAVED